MQDLIDLARLGSMVCIPGAAIFGIICLVMSFRFGKTVQDMSNWKKTRGKILECRTGTVVTKMRTRVGSGKIGEQHSVGISYEYVVDGKKYVGNRFKIAQQQIRVGSRQEGDKIASKFNSVSEMDVYYDPKNPKLAVLKPSTPGDNKTDPTSDTFWGGIILVIASVAMFFIFRPYGF